MSGVRSELSEHHCDESAGERKRPGAPDRQSHRLMEKLITGAAVLLRLFAEWPLVSGGTPALPAPAGPVTWHFVGTGASARGVGLRGAVKRCSGPCVHGRTVGV
ncbi:hypothetical protein AAFF_G00071470 [Aldrovandia affinis]|uniref:Uncharacterized protein n=1 Tax=Aldrovandia affinis TaxID=143900 RepID=A0AAD7RZ97_9TELE|nr:hypothetical protein AAFF_G00071470 [Aldrovandia affinis]